MKPTPFMNKLCTLLHFDIRRLSFPGFMYV